MQAVRAGAQQCPQQFPIVTGVGGAIFPLRADAVAVGLTEYFENVWLLRCGEESFHVEIV